MTNLAWPDDLPISKFSGLNGQYQNAVIRTEMDAGPAKQRLRYTAVPKKFKAGLTLTEAQRSELETFWKDTLAFGTLRFTMKNPQTGIVQEFRFVEPYSEDGNDSGLYDISMQLERLV